MKRYIVSRKTGKMFTLNRPGISKNVQRSASAHDRYLSTTIKETINIDHVLRFQELLTYFFAITISFAWLLLLS